MWRIAIRGIIEYFTIKWAGGHYFVWNSGITNVYQKNYVRIDFRSSSLPTWNYQHICLYTLTQTSEKCSSFMWSLNKKKSWIRLSWFVTSLSGESGSFLIVLPVYFISTIIWYYINFHSGIFFLNLAIENSKYCSLESAYCVLLKHYIENIWVPNCQSNC